MRDDFWRIKRENEWYTESNSTTEKICVKKVTELEVREKEDSA